MAMGFSLIKPSTEHMPPLRMSTDLYNSFSFYDMEKPLDMNIKMRDTMMQEPYVGTVCMDGSPFRYSTEKLISLEVRSQSYSVNKAMDRHQSQPLISPHRTT